MAISVNNLKVRYGRHMVVHDLSFEAPSPSILGLLGPNGAGKSTIMKCIAGILFPFAGEIKVDGHIVHPQSETSKQLIGYLSEENPLYRSMYVMESLKYHCRFYGVKDAGRRMEEVCEQTGLADVRHKKIGQLSKGYRQRVGIAHAIVHDPKAIILDEPTSGLDPNQMEDMRKLIADLGRSKTIILSTHSLPEAKKMSDSILLINKGMKVYEGAISAFVSDNQVEMLDELFMSLKYSDLNK